MVGPLKLGIAAALFGIATFSGAVVWFGIVKPQAERAAPAGAAPGDPAKAVPGSPAAPPPRGEEPRPQAALPGPEGPAPGRPDAPAGPAEPGRRAEEAAAKAPAPSFDIVRVEPSGETVIAGRGVPGATIEMTRNGRVHARAVADQSGLFALVPPPLPPGDHEIVLQSIAPDGARARSRESVTVVVDADKTTRPLVALASPDRPTVLLSNPEPPQTGGGSAPAKPGEPSGNQTAQVAPPVAGAQGPGPAGGQGVGQGSGQGPGQVSGQGPGQGTGQAAEQGVRQGTGPGALPAPGAQAALDPARPGEPARPPGEARPPARRPEVKIVAIDAEGEGRLFVSGQAAPGATVRLYLNDALIAPGSAGGDGRVSFAIGRGVRPGDYRVRLDDVDPVSGEVKTRAEVAFAVPAPKPMAEPRTGDQASLPGGGMATAQPPGRTAPHDASSGSSAGYPPGPGLTAGQGGAGSDASSGPAASDRSGVIAGQGASSQGTPGQVAAGRQAPGQASPGQGAAGRGAPEGASPDRPGSNRTAAAGSMGPAPADLGLVVVPEVNTAIVARGDNLWRISRRIYGQGERYTVIYGANSPQIRDPDLIYPGQVFVLPSPEAAKGQGAGRGSAQGADQGASPGDGRGAGRP